MTVESFATTTGFKPITIPTPDKEVNGAYIGDLLSWVMGRAESGNVWITIMSNINIIAVATLADVSCIVLAEGVIPDEDVIATATAKGVNLLSSERSTFETASVILEIK